MGLSPYHCFGTSGHAFMATHTSRAKMRRAEIHPTIPKRVQARPGNPNFLWPTERSSKV